MTPRAYYSEFDPYAAEWLRCLIREGLVMQGDVDERSICDVAATDLRGYTRCHFFAGIGIWDLALQYAGWPADRPVWTGSCPCQPYSPAGKKKGKEDARHLWPEFHRLIDACRPACVIGEQVPAAIGHGWLDDLCDDMAESGYETRSLVLPACSIGSPTIRQRLFWVSHAGPSSSWDDAAGECVKASAGEAEEPKDRIAGEPGRYRGDCGLSHASGTGSQGRQGHTQAEGEHAAVHGDAGGLLLPNSGGRETGRVATEAARYGGAIEPASGFSPDECDWLHFADGKTRPAQRGIFCLADGVAFRLADGHTRTDKKIRAKILKAIGNAIVPDVAAAFVRGWMDTQQ